MFKVRRFVYNGVFGQTREGFTNYEAEFKYWTDDPGIAVCSCSDDIERRIPTFALVGFVSSEFPKQTYDNGKTLFGVPSNDSIC